MSTLPPRELKKQKGMCARLMSGPLPRVWLLLWEVSAGGQYSKRKSFSVRWYREPTENTAEYLSLQEHTALCEEQVRAADNVIAECAMFLSVSECNCEYAGNSEGKALMFKCVRCRLLDKISSRAKPEQGGGV